MARINIHPKIMEIMMFRYKKLLFRTKKPTQWKFIVLIISSVYILNGCAAISVVPVTLKEVKDYAFGQQQSFGYPLEKVLKATVLELRQMEFTIKRIEAFNHKGLIFANTSSLLPSTLVLF